ncbi:MAG: helix-turn-helix domain-containing protein [Steroidobacter sp.]|jgi:hypothetical protein
MKPGKRKKLQSAGWKIGSVDEFLDLPEDESAYIEMKLALSESLRKKRIKKKLSQVAFANLISSSQSRVAKMEAGDATVSMDLLIKSLLAIGASPNELANTIRTRK